MKNIEINPTEGLKLVGYGELVRQYFLDVIPHYVKSFIAEKGRRETKFEQLTNKEVAQMEECVRNAFNRTTTDV